MEPRERAPWFPLFLDMRGRKVLVVGGGEVAARKVRSFVGCGAVVTVVAERASAPIVELSSSGQVHLLLRPFEQADVEGQSLVIAATNNAAVNAAAGASSRALGIWTNVVDDPELCDFIVPAVVNRGSIQLAVSTGGSSPALAREIRRKVESAIGEEWSDASDILAALRQEAKRVLPSDDDRRAFFEAILATGFVALLAEGKIGEARNAVAGVCERWGVQSSD